MVSTFSSWCDCGFFLRFTTLGTIRGVGVVGVVGVVGFVVRDSDMGRRGVNSCTNKSLNDLYCQQSSGLGLILSSQQCF